MVTYLSLILGESQVLGKWGEGWPLLKDQNLPCNSYLSPIISLQLVNIIPAENCRDFRFHSGLDLLYLSSSLSWNILLSQPLSHHSYTLTYANWHRIVKGSSYRFIPPSCDLSSLRFGPGRIQKPVTGPGARTRKFSMREMHSKRKDSWSAPLAQFANSTFNHERSRQNWLAGWAVWGWGRN